MKKVLAFAFAATLSVALVAGCINGNFEAYAPDGELWCCIGVGDGSVYSCTNGEIWALYE